MSKLHSKCLDEPLEKNEFCGDKVVFFCFRTRNEIFRMLGKVFHRSSQTCIFCVQRIFLVSLFFCGNKKFFQSFSDSERHRTELSQKLLAGIPNFLSLQWNLFEENRFLRKQNRCLSTSTLRAFYFGGLPVLSRIVENAAVYVSRKKL